MPQPPKRQIPGLNRGAGVPQAYLLGRLPGAGKGPVQLISHEQLSLFGIHSVKTPKGGAISAGISTSLSAVTSSVATITGGFAALTATMVVTVNSSPYTPAAATATVTYLDITNTSGGPLQINLPGSPVVGQRFVILDAGGTAGTNAFTIKAGATTIDTITTNGGWSSVRWNGANWVLSA